jgi:hypothetical protein
MAASDVGLGGARQFALGIFKLDLLREAVHLPGGSGRQVRGEGLPH